MKDSPAANTGNATPPNAAPGELKDGLVLLPRFISRHPDGLYVDISMVESTANFQHFVDRVFSAQTIFAGLNYPLFLKLLYEPDSPELLAHVDSGGAHPELKLARDIVPFKEERRPLYHPVRISDDGCAAEYFFAPVSIDEVSVEPVFGPPAEDGGEPLLRYETKTKSVRTHLDLDEFIASMWLQGIRYGIDVKGVQAAIAKDGAERREIARERKLQPGTDASVKEKTTVLHRDDAPKILANGRIDLRQFNNHFPQVDAGKKLLQKTPRLLGQPGFSVKGEVFEPEMPKDFDIDSIAGPGTRVERTGEGEFIVAAMTGFVNVDTESNLISVTEKIVNRGGISLRTTGDLALSGADFEEHGEVQERRQVRGHNMNFHADVFGEVSSDGGVVQLHKALAGGAVRNPGGRIVIDKSASRSIIEARGGSIEIGAAESCTVIGTKVKIGRAVNCDIVAEEADIGSCEGCAIAARRLTVAEAKSRKAIENVVTVLLPDGVRWDRDLAALAKKSEESEKARIANRAAAAQIAEQPEVKKFLGLLAKVKQGDVVIAANQEAGWKAAQAKFAGVTRQMEKLDADLRALLKLEAGLASEVEAIEAARKKAIEALSCKLGAISGHTIVRTLRAPGEGVPLGGLSAKEVHHILRLHGTPKDKLFVSDSGAFEWSGSQFFAGEE